MNATHHRIRGLLARYDAAESTLAEERELRGLLADPAHGAAFPEAAATFGVWEVLATAAPGPALTHAPWNRRSRLRRLARPLALAAALVGLLVAVYLAGALSEAPPEAVIADNAPAPTAVDWARYEITDPAEAARITQAALGDVSTRLARGSRIASREVGRMHPIHHATSTY